MGASDRFSQTITRDKIDGAAQWELRPLATGTRAPGPAPLSKPGNGRELSGFEAGQAQGYAEALRNAQAARAADLQRFETMLQQMQTRFDELTLNAADALLDLALDVAAQVVRHEIRTDRSTLMPVVREALALVIDTHAHPTVRVSPQDFELVRGSLQADGQFHGCRVQADPGITQGGCRVETPHGEVDATLPTRWRRVVQNLGVNVPPPDVSEPPADPAGPAVTTTPGATRTDAGAA